MADPVYFSGSPLDRASAQRRDEAWLKERLDDEASRYLPVWRLQPLVKSGSERGLAWARKELRGLVETPPILLGLAVSRRLTWLLDGGRARPLVLALSSCAALAVLYRALA